MFVWRFSWAVLALLLVSSAWAEEDDVAVNEEDDDTLLERVNMDLTPDFDEPELIEGDIAVESEAEKNADPCTAGKCLWEKSSDGMVYVPYAIHNDSYSPREKATIERGLESFSAVSCIRFIPYRDGDKHWISIESKKGCYSFVGRRGPGQKLSLGRRGCLYMKAIQHELLHSLGYHHEQTRSDRDDHIQILWENIIDNKKANFGKKNTNNLDTSYDYNSIMQYVRTAFSKNKQPTMIPIPDSTAVLGKAKQMSQNDIDRLNRLYKCQTEENM